MSGPDCFLGLVKEELTENICKQCDEPSYLGFSHCKKCHDYLITVYGKKPRKMENI